MSEQPLNLLICSDGGDLDCANAIVDIMYAHGNVNTIAVGKCCSGGAFVLGHGKVRYSMPNTAIMLHPGMHECSDYINHQVSWTVFSKQHFGRLIKSLAARLNNISPEKLSDMIKDTLWLTPTQAKKIGLIDKICTSLPSQLSLPS